MKRTILSVIIMSTVSVSAHAITVEEGAKQIQAIRDEANLAHQNMKRDLALYNYDHSIDNFQKDQQAVRTAESRIAAIQAEVSNTLNQDAADAKTASARLNSPSATASHSLGWTQTPGIVKESNPAGHPTNQIAPATHLDRNYADINASAQARIGASKEHDNQVRTSYQHVAPHETATKTPDIDRSAHLDAPDHSRETQKAQRAAENAHGEALAQSNRDRTASQKPAASHLDGVHSDSRQPSHSTATATPNNVDRSSHLDGVHSEPAHVTATATPNVDRSQHLAAPEHAAQAAAAQAKAVGDAMAEANRQRTASQHPEATHLDGAHEEPVHVTATAKPDTAAVALGAQLTQANVDRTATQKVDANAVAQADEQTAHFTRYNMTIQPAKVSVSMSTLTPATKPAEVIGVKTPVETVPVTVTNVTTPVVSVPFSTHKGNGDHNTHGSMNYGGHSVGSDNAHDHAFGGHTGAGGGFHY